MKKGHHTKKNYIVTLQLGKEQYKAEGGSIKKAKTEVAKLALNSTAYAQPPRRPLLSDQHKQNKSKVQQLEEWVNRRTDVEVIYSYTNKPHHKDSNHDLETVREDNIYSKEQNMFVVDVKVSDLIGTRGEGTSAVAAKEDAAKKALSELKSASAFCLFVDNSIFDFLSNKESPVSLVYQFGNNLGNDVNFEMIEEEGPAHIKRFVYKCSVGDDYETLGEGSSKKGAKKAAASAMIKHLQSVAPEVKINCDSIVKRKSKNKKPKNFVKSVPVKPPYEFDDDAKNENLFPKDLDPVSKLFQIQQAKHETLPEFKLMNEEVKNPNEFQMEVNVGDLVFVGSGRNKKEAKRNAAEGMLKKLGMVVDGDKTRLASSEHKAKKFEEKKSFTSGSKHQDKVNTKEDGKENKKPKSSHKSHKESKSNYESDTKKNADNPKNQLKHFAQQMGFKFQFSDFPRKGNSGLVSAVSMTTNPPLICVGYGADSSSSQDRAALSALERLYKIQLQSISQTLHEEDEEEEEQLRQEFSPAMPPPVMPQNKL